MSKRNRPSSELLNDQLSDLWRFYESAEAEADEAKVASYAKIIPALAKQIKEHEEHERKTIPRSELMAQCGHFGDIIYNAIVKSIGDEYTATLIMDDIIDQLTSQAEKPL